jgi:hypothetical protein
MDMSKNELSKAEEAAMEAARERSAVPHLRDVLKRERDEALPRNVAMEKWGPFLEEQILRSFRRRNGRHPHGLSHQPTPLAREPQKRGPDLDKE